MAYFRKIKAGLVKDDIENFVGEEGNIFFNVETGELRLSDGTTPGGIGIGGGGGGGNYTLPTASTTVKGGVKIDGTTITINNQVISGFSGNYNDLSNRPTIPTNTNQLTNGSGFITSSALTGYATESFVTSQGYLTSVNWNNISNKPTFATVATSGSYTDLTNKPNIPTPLTVSLINTNNTVTNTLSNITTLRFDTDSGFDITDLGSGAVKVGMNSTFKTWKVDGQSDLVATGLDTIRLVAGAGMSISTNPLADPKTITFTSTGGTGSGTGLIKTFNILNEFSAPLLGKSIFVPVSTDTIRSVQLINSRAVGSDLMVGLYRNNELLNFFTISAGNYTNTFSGLNYTINTNDYLTVNVVAGTGENFSMGLFNIDI